MTTTDAQVKAELKEMYDELAAEYDAVYRPPAGQYFMNRKVNTMLELTAFPRGSHLLEVGCANGVYTFELARLGFQMTGLDLSPECVRVATQQAERAGLSHIDFTVGDAETLSQFEDNTFDGVISFSVLRYVSDPARAIREIHRVLRPGGMAVVDFPNKRSPWFTFLKPLLTGQTHIHDHQYTTGQVKRMLQEAGFQKLSLRRILYTPKTIPGWALPVMRIIDYVGERTPGFNQFASIIMAGGRKL
jgi:ubiquinone/menaquinone biosynthesis C-methylase UbiE